MRGRPHRDFTTGNGLTGAGLTDEQSDLLVGLIANGAGMADEQTTKTELAKIEASLDDTVIPRVRGDDL